MKLIFYYIYFFLIAVPVLLTATILAATITIIGSALGGASSVSGPARYGGVFSAFSLW